VVDQITIAANLENVEPQCKEKQDIAGSCGMHFHEGTCESPGNHYFDANSVQNPWGDVVYKASSDGKAAGKDNMNVHVNTGYALPKHKDAVFAVHDYAGEIAVCTEVQDVHSTDLLIHNAEFTQYDGYSGDLEIKGHAEVYQVGDDSQYLTFDLTGLPTEGCGVDDKDKDKNQCGIHIHEGKDCSTNTGGHFWDKAGIPEDPWAYVRYVVDTNGNAKGTTALIKTGKTAAELSERALVVHDELANRTACTIITKDPKPPSPAPSPSPDTAPSPPASPSPSPSPSPGPSPGESDEGGVSGVAIAAIVVVVAALCGGGGYYYMNQEGGYENQEDAEVEMQEQEG